MALTTALIVGPNNAAIAGPNGAVLAGPNYAAPFTDYTQGLGMVVGDVGGADWQAAEAAWIKANASNVTFTREIRNGERSYFTNTAAIPRATLYCNFTTALDSELTQWETTYGVAAVDAMKMKAPNGSTYTDINDNETLMDFTNTTWLDLRLSDIPEYNATNKLGNLANLDALSMDLCPLYPVKNLTPVHGNPFATEALWRANMLACIAYVRDRVDNDIHLFVNGLRQYYHEEGSGFKDNPATFEDYDGRDAIEPGNYGSAAGIEVGLDYKLGSRWKMLYSLRALYRASSQGLCVAPAMKVDTSARFVSEDENQRRINNLAVYALIHEADFTRFTQRGNKFSQYPGRVLPEMDIVLGTPVEAVASMFTGYDEPVAQLFTRTFSGGYTVLYNWDNKSVAIPTTYQSAYQQIRPTRDTGLLANGTTDSAIEFAPGATLTVTTASLAQLTGEVQLFFGVGSTGMMIDTGEFVAGRDRTEVKAVLDIQDGDDWEISVQGKDQPGVRDDRQAADFVPMASGAQNTGTGGQGRWVRVIIRALAPLLHRLGATEIEVKDDE
jgi:hypothetical protein